MTEDTPNPLLIGRPKIPRRGAIETGPLIFDTRTQAWKIYFPDTPEAQDPDRNSADWPRQKAVGSCNILELYDRLKVAFEYYQMEYRLDADTPTVIEMPFQFIEPKAGWKLRNLTTNKEYEVKGTGRINTRTGPVFNGYVHLKGSVGPDHGDELIWLDPDGMLDSQPKLVKLQPSDQLGSVMDIEAGAGDMAGAKSKPFVPMVTYELVTQEPGSIQGRPFAPAKQTKPRLRESYVDPMDPREIIEIHGWWMDTLIDFKCVAVSPELADRMTVWVRTFFQLYTSLLKYLGVQEILYRQTSSAKLDGRPVKNLYIRSLVYYFRLEELTVKRYARLRHFNLVTRLLGPDEEMLASGETSELDLNRWDATHDTSDQYLYGDVSIGDDD